MDTEGPLQKKAKKVETDSVQSGSVNEVDPSYYLAQLHPRLSWEETRDFEKAAVFVATITDPKQTSKIIAYLGTHFPVPSLSHLKRIHKTLDTPSKMLVLICPIADFQTAPVQVREHLMNTFGLELYETGVPKHCPVMRTQYEAWNRVWPCILKAHVQSTPPPADYFNSSTIVSLANHMHDLIRSLTSKEDNACLILSPAGSVLAQAHCTHDNPLTHCAINAINMVAAQQLQCAPDVAIEHQHRNEAPPEPKTAEYLCTDCTALLVREPCVMCSMALLHSRISCVIYAKPNSSIGGLGSRYSIHCEPRLNHHFYVYSGLIEAEAETLDHLTNDRSDS